MNIKNFFYQIKLAYSYLIKLLTPFLIIMSPSFLSWLTHFNSNLRRFPTFKDRIKKTKNPLDEFIFYSESNKRFDEVNMVMRGQYSEKINKELPTFFININQPQKDFPIRYYSSSDRLKFKAMMGDPERIEDQCLDYDDKEKKFYYFIAISPLIEKLNLNKENLSPDFVARKITELKKILNFKPDYKLCVCCHKFNGLNIQVGSGILALISILNISKKVNVYGWDSFLNEDLKNSFFQQTFKLWSPFKDHQPVSRFAANVFNWIYAHRLINYFTTDRLIVHGRVRKVANLEWIEKRLYKMVYK